MLPCSFSLGISGRDHISVTDEHHRLQRGIAARPLQQDAVLIHLHTKASEQRGWRCNGSAARQGALCPA